MRGYLKTLKSIQKRMCERFTMSWPTALCHHPSSSLSSLLLLLLMWGVWRQTAAGTGPSQARGWQEFSTFSDWLPCGLQSYKFEFVHIAAWFYMLNEFAIQTSYGCGGFCLLANWLYFCLYCACLINCSCCLPYWRSLLNFKTPNISITDSSQFPALTQRWRGSKGRDENIPKAPYYGCYYSLTFYYLNQNNNYMFL